MSALTTDCSLMACTTFKEKKNYEREIKVSFVGLNPKTYKNTIESYVGFKKRYSRPTTQVDFEVFCRGDKCPTVIRVWTFVERVRPTKESTLEKVYIITLHSTSHNACRSHVLWEVGYMLFIAIQPQKRIWIILKKNNINQKW